MGIWDKFYEKARSFFTGEEGTSESTATKTRCYYDLLEVDRDAGEEEIKKSFKKLALKWHPDKNPGKEEECAAYFILIQQAYEVLSDPQERAFYDRHRENIIYQNTDGPDEQKDNGIVLEPFMNTGCWRSGIFTSEEERQEKFYSVYRDLFHQLAAEEYAYIEDPEERNYPVFGTFTSDYETVVAPFYAFWLNFSTRRSFAWLDKWNMREAPDRATARYMEKENRKNREHGRKLRSDEIRKLVEFIRKHDKRVELARQRQKERNEAIQKKVEEQRRQAIRRNLERLETFEMDEEAEKKHLMDLEQIEAALDAQFGTVNSATTAGDEESGDEDGASGFGSDDEDGDEFQCIVCEKTFKSRNVLDNHQQSKKHRQMVELLRTHMREEDQQLFEEENVWDEARGSSQEEEDVQPQRRGKRKKKKKGGAIKDEEKEEKNRPKMEDKAKGEKEAAQSDGQQQNAEEEINSATTNNVKSKKARRRAAGGGSGTTGGCTEGGKNNNQKPREPTGPVACECITCGAEFDSKSQLHAHLKSSGHAVLKTVQTAASKPATQIGEGGGGGKKGGKVKKNRRNKEREE